MTTQSATSPTVILINNNGMGRGDAEFQQKLIRTYFRLLIENKYLPTAICFYTEGVRLVVEGSPILEELRILEQSGIRLVICGTCLNHYGLADKVQVGIVGGMNDILEYQWLADKVITL
jgi:selenium metabolism protein YedF